MEQRHDKQAQQKGGSPADEDLRLPAIGSSFSTDALVAAHLRICKDENGGSKALRPKSPDEAGFAKILRGEFKSLLCQSAHSPRFRPARIFLHSERIIPGNEQTPMALNFLAEVRNSSGDFIALSHQGWSVHPFNCPAFMHAHASALEPSAFELLKLYSQDAFENELGQIASRGMKLIIGMPFRSYILEESLSRIQNLRQGRALEPSSVTSIEVASCSADAAVLKLNSLAEGNFELSVALDPRFRHLTVSVRNA